MNRTYRHLFYAVAWLLTFTAAIVIFFEAANSGPFNPRMAAVFSAVGSAIWVIGFAVIFYSWARKDAVAYGRSSRFALIFTILWPFINVVSLAAYLLITRGLKQGLLAVLKFVCFFLATGIIWFEAPRVSRRLQHWRMEP